ncbi:ABC transporter ATP-binding protein [Ammoniphilus resinae]|uniref:Sn-glycerol 3-phosphate transport system ATP-binding protein n=1 Tax=Ammoniphilus resinae TaxID=861532 RepID=A0ABS4GQQ1_9BACL|nr:ABC transporter ATP-binding protein [Ammoniphilus resinae]MBP1932215.1 sn-glycerol 3-phosphate transport system ATP-binding protein [Ammoniphilus resinae]
MARVLLKQVVKAFQDQPVVKGLDLTIPNGSFTVLVGPSGCGKSTTLRMIAGLEEVTDGEIWIGDRKVNDVPPGKRDLAMVFQNYALYPTMNVFENIAFGLQNRGLPRQECKSLVHEIAEVVGLTSYLDRKPSELSGGQRQRVALARAMVKKPQVFLMDEPLSNLDAKLRNQMRVELTSLHKQLGSTFIYVTHDQVEAMTMGDQIVVMNEGRIQQVASPVELYQDPTNLFVAQFIGSPAMNILSWEEEESCLLGFRPEKGRIAATIQPSTEEKGISLRGKVRSREILGAEVLYYVDTRKGQIIVKANHDVELIAEDEDVRLSVAAKDLYFFDEKTGMRVMGQHVHSLPLAGGAV